MSNVSGCEFNKLENMCHHVQTFHESVRVFSLEFKENLGRFNYLTPTSFLELISSFQVHDLCMRTLYLS
jgi:hypothetical protein